MVRRVVALPALALALAGCMTTASNTLPQDRVASFRVTAVNVGFSRDARIVWGDGERAYAATKGLPAHQSDTVANTPEAQSYMRNVIGSKMKAAMGRRLSERLKGSNPVRVDVTISELSLSSAVQRILVGGHHTLTADVSLVDAKTGAVLIEYPAQKSTSMAGQGIGGALLDQALLAEPLDRVADGYASEYAYWLMPDDKTRQTGGM